MATYMPPLLLLIEHVHIFLPRHTIYCVLLFSVTKLLLLFLILRSIIWTRAACMLNDNEGFLQYV